MSAGTFRAVGSVLLAYDDSSKLSDITAYRLDEAFALQFVRLVPLWVSDAVLLMLLEF